MTSTILTIVVGLLSITSSHALQPSTTTNCNYALDTWWQTVSPPSQSPTPAPIDPPTRSPTPEPTEVNQTTITSTNTRTTTDHNWSSEKESPASILLHPYAINQCYSLNFLSEPFNEVAWKYTCTNAYTLKREIWFDSLECTSTASDTIEISENQRGRATQFICSASEPCAYADISVVPAITQSPTQSPTEEPTELPTPYPTPNNLDCAFVRNVLGYCGFKEEMLNIAIANATCQCDYGCEYRNPTDCCYDFEDVCFDDLTGSSSTLSGGSVQNTGDSGGSSSDFFLSQCNNDNGPQPEADPVLDWKYATNICVNMFDFYGDLEGENPENYDGIVYNIGWQCINNIYYMAFFFGSDCSQNSMKYIQYSDNKCAFDGSMWATVACSEDYQAPPTKSPIEVVGDDTGGVKRNGIVIVVVMVLALVVSMEVFSCSMNEL